MLGMRRGPTFRRRVRDAQAGPARRAVERASEDEAAAANEYAAVAAQRPRERIGVVGANGGRPAVVGFGQFLCFLGRRRPDARGNEAQESAVGLAVPIDRDEGSLLDEELELCGANHVDVSAFIPD